ncbi:MULTISPECIES: DUF4845 domain-containing protein [Thiorhodovibrio]|uniref:DUF4845 domain-containing protein n=1 Tax=Thiorhodovibrio TaxID=61593 RepID=UPI00191253AF|nr:MULTISPECIES: DUF4845 domain-containing protein [Thiorhodovibrio]MBK5970559.1 hypothetical protein [Thiorhodovibrio winogradskyi]WPL12815.1 hypothetical protein Thiosp_02594 [Thiorhodovibrio litoralis]
MRNLRIHQRGLTFSTAMLIVALASFFLMLLFKMGPAYFQFWQVRSAMDKVLERPELGQQGPRAILSAIDKQLYINEVRTVPSDSFSVKTAKDGKGWDIFVEYVVQQHIGANVDVLMNFNYSVILPKKPQ